MKKLRLDLEAVTVESFDVTHAEQGHPGTVFGHYPTRGDSCSCQDCGDSGFPYSCMETYCDGSRCVVYCNSFDLCASNYPCYSDQCYTNNCSAGTNACTC
jgi:hypothetical protein